MPDEVIELMNAIFSAIVALLCLCLSNYRLERNKEYAEKYANNATRLILRLLLTWLLKGISVIMILGMMAKVLNPFIAFHILTPVLIALNLILFDSTHWMWGFMTFVKGFYYLGLIIISTVQFLHGSAEMATLALGFTLSLAIFESITALSDGYKKMQEAKQTLPRQRTEK